MREGIYGIVSLVFSQFEDFGLAAVHASVTAGGVEGAAASQVVELDASGIGWDDGIGDVYLELCHGSFQFYRLFGFLAGDVESAVIIKGVGEFVVAEFYLFRRADGTVAGSVMSDDDYPVFTFVQGDGEVAVSLVCRQGVEGLHLSYFVEDAE